MKILLSLIIVCAALSANAASFYQFNRFDTNLDGTLINGNTLTNVTAAPPTITYTNLISGLVYHNLTGRPQMTIQGINVNCFNQNGTAVMSFYVDPNGGVDWSRTNRVGQALNTSSITEGKFFELVGVIPIGASYVMTNTSTGASPSAQLDATQTGLLITY
jgi:hypothetical protein